MGHPMEDYWLGESMARDRLRARAAVVFSSLEKIPLADFTVGQLADLVQLVSGNAENEWLERLEAYVADRCRLFKSGMEVRYKKPKKGQKGIGIVQGRPRKGSRIVYVQGPRGWAGWTHIDDLEIVEP